MNKTAIKNFSIWARNKLIADISYRAGLMGITEEGIANPLPQSTDTTEFYDIGTTDPYTITGIEVKQRKDLVDAIHRKEADSDYETAYKYIIEEVAYTWFNRLIAVRFMEVNDYLPSHIRVLSSESGKMEPDLVTTPFDADLEFTAEEEKQIISLQCENALDEMFRLLFVKQCNALNNILPVLFEKTGDYTELLLNLSVTDKDSVVYHLVHDIDEADFDIEMKDENGDPIGQVEIIGWLYQYYNTEPKAKVFDRPPGAKINKEEIPAATQLFTPDWIVRYMVENSLGRLWVEGHPNNELKTSWKYYLDEAEQEPEVEEQLNEIRKEYSLLTPEDIRIIDPCMGSGHILVYAFDVLIQVYETQGYTKQNAVKSILENNLFGLDIDERATQLTYFAVMMKARNYDRHFFSRGIQPHVYAIQESNNLSAKWLSLHEQMQLLFDYMKDAKEYGSIIETPELDYNALRNVAQNSVYGAEQINFETEELQRQLSKLLSMIDVAELLSQKFEVVITNPPYMGGSGMSRKLGKFVKEFYPDSKSDLFAVFIEHCGRIVKEDGYQAMITQQSWMFLSSFENLRAKMLQRDFINMAHLGIGTFEDLNSKVVQSVAFIQTYRYVAGYKGSYNRLFEKQGSQEDNKKKSEWLISRKHLFIVDQSCFSKIPGSPVAYWASEKLRNVFSNSKLFLYDESVSPSQNITGNNNKYIRKHWEIDSRKVGEKSSWIFYAKGGGYRKWWGNLDDVVNWSSSARKIYQYGDGIHASQIINHDYWYKKGITWGLITTALASFRVMPEGGTFDKAGSTIIITNESHYNFVLGLLNSKIYIMVASILNPTISLQVKDVRSMPLIFQNEDKVNELVKWCIDISKRDWDCFETSWEFKSHPFVRWSKKIFDGMSNTVTMDFYYENHPRVYSSLESCWLLWQDECKNRFTKLKSYEENLNHIFIDIYGLQDELSPEVEDKDISVRKADLQRDIRSFLSYAVGCMFGRYSLDIDGLAYAGGNWDDSKYTSFKPDTDDIIPITDEEYLEDDIIVCLCQWLKVVYGEEALEKNLDFIAQALGNKGDSSREVIRNYFLKDFFTDHCKIYQKKPIYWLFDSGKQNGFKALVYLHRYTPDTIGNLRIDYLHRMQRIYEGEVNRMQDIIDQNDNSREVTKATKRKEKLQKQLKECKEYDEKISHLALSRIELDFDDGVKKNYEKVQIAKDGVKYQVLAKI